MAQIQDVYNRIQESRKEMREIKKDYRNALQNNQAYVDIMDEMKKLRTQKKQIEETIKESFAKDFDKLEELKLDIDSDQQMISDMALNKLVKGESVELEDGQYKYEPIFTVKFVKQQ